MGKHFVDRRQGAQFPGIAHESDGTRRRWGAQQMVYWSTFGAWLSLVERLVRDQEVEGSNPSAPTNTFNKLTNYKRWTKKQPTHLPTQIELPGESKVRTPRPWQTTQPGLSIQGGASERQPREKLLEAARRHEIDVVLVWRLDRRGRSVADLLPTLQELDHLGVGFGSLAEALDLTTPAGRAMALRRVQARPRNGAGGPKGSLDGLRRGLHNACNRGWEHFSCCHGTRIVLVSLKRRVDSNARSAGKALVTLPSCTISPGQPSPAPGFSETTPCCDGKRADAKAAPNGIIENIDFETHLWISPKTAVEKPPSQPSSSAAGVCSHGTCHPLGEMRRSCKPRRVSDLPKALRVNRRF